MRKAGYRAAADAQMSKVKTVWVILMENHNWTGDNSGAAFGDPDIKGSPLAPYAGVLLDTAGAVSQPTRQPFQRPVSNVQGRLVAGLGAINVT